MGFNKKSGDQLNTKFKLEIPTIIYKISVIILGGSNYALPPAWLNIPGHRSCLGTVENIVNGHTEWCLPTGKPSGCSQNTWDQVSNAFQGTIDARYSKYEG